MTLTKSSKSRSRSARTISNHVLNFDFPITMPYGVPPRQFIATFTLCFLSMSAGSLLVHSIMQPDRTIESFTEEERARTRAIAEIQNAMRTGAS